VGEDAKRARVLSDAGFKDSGSEKLTRKKLVDLILELLRKAHQNTISNMDIQEAKETIDNLLDQESRAAFEAAREPLIESEGTFSKNTRGIKYPDYETYRKTNPL